MSSTKKPKIIARRSPAPASLALPAGYREFLEDVKSRIRSTQVRAALSASRELIGLYWDLGNSIVERQDREGWGKAVVERLAADLQKEFPGVGGFSGGNLWRMRAFVLGYSGGARNSRSLREI